MFTTNIVEAVYIIYMFNFFKTKYSFHNPLENIISKNQNISKFFKHPISTNKHENKICKFGKLISYLLAFWIIIRVSLNKKYNTNAIFILNSIIFILLFIFSFILNINSFIYLIPVFIYEAYLIYHKSI